MVWGCGRQSFCLVTSESKSKTNEAERLNTQLRYQYMSTKEALEALEPDSRSAKRVERKLARIADDFIRSNLGLATLAARPFTGGGRSQEDRDDYKAAAAGAMWEAFLSWDPEKGSFSTWSRRFRDGAVRRAVNTVESPEISYGDFSARPAVLRAVAELEAAGEDSTDISAVAEAAGVTKGVAERVMMARPTSLPGTSGDEDGNSQDRHIQLQAPSEQLQGGSSDIPDAVKDALNTLTPLELWVYARAHGFDGAAPQPKVRIAASIGVGRNPVSKALLAAEAKMEDMLDGADLALMGLAVA